MEVYDLVSILLFELLRSDHISVLHYIHFLRWNSSIVGNYAILFSYFGISSKLQNSWSIDHWWPHTNYVLVQMYLEFLLNLCTVLTIEEEIVCLQFCSQCKGICIYKKVWRFVHSCGVFYNSNKALWYMTLVFILLKGGRNIQD